jgi:hypothetical protein
MQNLFEKRARQLFWLIPLSFYIFTMAKTIGYVDAALILNNAYHLDINAWVNNHNLFSLLGWIWIRIFPLGDEFFRLNLLSAIFGAFTVYFIFLTCFEYTRSILVSFITSLALMISHSLWWHSTMLEVYTLNTLIIALILYTVLKYYLTHQKKWFFFSLFFWGLGISNHILMSLFIGAFAVFIIIERKQYSSSDIIKGGLFFVAGLSIFIFACLKTYIRFHSLLVLFDYITGGDFKSLMFASVPKLFWRLNYLFVLIYQYPSLILFFLFYGTFLLFAQRQKFDFFLIAALVPQIAWSANYFIWDMYAFSLPVYVMLSIVICKGIYQLKNRRKVILISFISLIIPFILYKNISKSLTIRKLAEQYPMVETVENSFDYVQYFFDPDKHKFNSVDQYVQELFNILPEKSWYLDNVYDYPIHYYYQQIRHIRPDINCPITFPFWITEDEKTAVANKINFQISQKNHIYLSKFIFTLLSPKLKYNRVEKLMIQNDEIYHIY